MSTLRDFFKNKFLIVSTALILLSIYTFLFFFASKTGFFTVLEALDNLSFVMPVAVPLIMSVVSVEKAVKNYGVLHTFVAVWMYFMSFLLLTLPFFAAELFINSSMFIKVVSSAYFISSLNVAIYVAVVLLCLVLFKNIAVRTIVSFAAVWFFYIGSFSVTYPFYKGLFDAYQALLLMIGLFAVLSCAFILQSKKYSARQKVMQFAVAMVIVISLHLIISPFGKYMFIDAKPVPSFVLTDGMKSVLKKLPKPVELTLSLSKKTIEENPKYANYAKVLEAFLSDVQRNSNGNIVIKNRVARFTDGSFVLTVSAPNTFGQEDIALPATTSEAFEEQLIKTIQKFAGVKKNVVGIASTLPLDGVETNGKISVPRWSVMNLIRQYYDVATVPFDTEKIPADIDVLLIVNPKANNKQEADKFTANFNAFMKNKGKAVIFTDVFPESAEAYPAYKNEGENFSENLLETFGISVKKGVLAVNNHNPVKVKIADEHNNIKEIPFIARFSVDGQNLNRAAGVLKNVEKINVTSAGILNFATNNNFGFLPLFTADYKNGISVKNSGDLKSPLLLTDNISLSEGITASSEPVAAMLTGNYEGRDVTLFVVADSDILYDQFWKSMDGDNIADNGDFVLNILDDLTDRVPLFYDTKESFTKITRINFSTCMILWAIALILSLSALVLSFCLVKRKAVRE